MAEHSEEIRANVEDCPHCGAAHAAFDRTHKCPMPVLCDDDCTDPECWCQGCKEPWMMYDDGSGTHGDCLGPSVPLGSLLPMQSGSTEGVSDGR